MGVRGGAVTEGAQWPILVVRGDEGLFAWESRGVTRATGLERIVAHGDTVHSCWGTAFEGVAEALGGRVE